MKFRIIALFLAFALPGVFAYFFFFGNDPSKGEAWRSQEATLSTLNSKLKTLTKDIQSVQGKSLCDGSGQCRVVGLGTRVCGYYKDFLIYSRKDADESRLLTLVASFNELHEKISSFSLAADSCGLKPATVRCLQGHCVVDVPNKTH